MKNKSSLLTIVCIVTCSLILNIAAFEEKNNLTKKDYPQAEAEKESRGYENIKNVALTALAFTANTFLAERIIRYTPPTLLITSLVASVCLFYAAIKLDLHKWCEYHEKSLISSNSFPVRANL